MEKYTKTRNIFFIVIITASLFFTSCKDGREPHVSKILNHIINTKKAILKNTPGGEYKNIHFVTFWDFDGTIQKGDCTTGLRIGGKKAFKGLAEKTIEANFSKNFPPGKFPAFQKEFNRLHEENHIEYLLSFARVLEGRSEKEIINFSENYFSSTLQNYFFSSSVEIIKALKKEGILIYIISASPDVYVQGSSAILDIPRYQIRGIAMKTEKGKISTTPVEPVTYAEGKTEVIKMKVGELKNKTNGSVYILAGFGNSYGTDGHFLAYISKLQLPAQKTISVMINGGETPAQYKNLFLEVTQKLIIGK